MKKNYVYADNAATTPMSEAAVKAMLPWLTEEFGNPSSMYSLAAKPQTALATAREAVAAVIGADPAEIFFTSGGTESDNWALRGAAYGAEKKGRHIITSAIEHHAVLEPLEQLEREGFELTVLKPDAFGRIDPESVRAAIRPDTCLCSIMTANNEVGTIQPIAEIGAICHEFGVTFHTDAVQAMGHIPVDVEDMQVDLLSASAHKFNGPKGVGFLYVRRGTRLKNLIHGGGQEKRRRSGTENVGGIMAMATALTEAVSNMREEYIRLSAMRDRLIAGVLQMPETVLTGHPTERLPGIASFSIRYIEGESIILSLDIAGIAASSGSACSTASLDPSHVLTSMGLSHEEAHGSLRLSLGRYNTEEDVDRILEALPPIVEKLRAMSPVWKSKK
ncbi:MAG: cysteine desulfurase NifS [Clostridia bacterium]|nr:cysteine desulfurase NifS [Clostridia bacterium]